MVQTNRYIGIDVAKETLAIFISENDYFPVTNNKDGFCEILKKLNKGDVIGVESTSNYHHELALFFINKGFEVKVLNPILTKQFIRSTIRKKKTDKSDAKIISLLLQQGEGHVITKDDLMNESKKLFRAKKKLTQMKTSLKLQLGSLEKEVKKNSFLKKTYFSLISKFEKEIKKVETQLLKTENSETKILESMHGFSPALARGVMAEIGDVKRFSNKKKLVAFAGYDPKLTESGTSVHHTGKLTKRGSPYIRNALHIVAFANINQNNVFSKYYHKKRGEGKCFMQAMVATSRKILEVVYTLLMKKEYFRDMSSNLT